MDARGDNQNQRKKKILLQDALAQLPWPVTSHFFCSTKGKERRGRQGGRLDVLLGTITVILGEGFYVPALRIRATLSKLNPEGLSRTSRSSVPVASSGIGSGADLGAPGGVCGGV